MRAVSVLILLGACAEEEPLTAAWHRAIALESVERGEGSCDPELAPADPDEPYLFVATNMGVPDVSSLYWCAGPESCDPGPFATVWVKEWTETRLAGTLATSYPLGSQCTVHWDGFEASRTEGGEVELTWRTFSATAEAIDAADCDAQAAAALETSCDSVVRFTGTQAD